MNADAWKRIADKPPPHGQPVIVAWDSSAAWFRNTVCFSAVMLDDAGDGHLEWYEYVSQEECEWLADERPTHWREYPLFDS